MKVAHLISEYLPNIGGAQICIHNISSKFVENNNAIVVITTAQDNILHNYFSIITVKVLWKIVSKTKTKNFIKKYR